ncbi:sulfite exporter TauE/SafE family protein [Candidatus Xianfuyuplasma coldseepsis]|uniref:Probable membrane transporter protein n=1 Tax=Candidatus Xianfuyuplasma coldseepsis TaxID=2782163 RepID=A0A7L7KUF1_9MOLU|nr:sulfite exporter TauE/SafE family protein [Xianfuyuplasma coldseepsis]QMS85398.1 sulfite exporter TauE/SafE family protein [Xianfuyuplasma coldseepsis]
MDIFVYIIGGFFAGIATGLVGLSAAVIIAPLFATVLGMDTYVAIGIALASDIFASSTSAFNYIRYKNVDLKRASYLAIMVIVFTIIGSIVSKDMNPYNMNSVLNIFVVVLGIRFFVYPVKDNPQNKLIKPGKFIIGQAIFWGIIIGLISGYFGSGGGLSMLAVLTMLLGFGLREAVGTSVTIMTVTAFVGAVTHILIIPTEWLPLIFASVAAFVGANLASIFANKVNEIILNRVIGGFLMIYGSILVLLFYTS